jgi:hypothetical protein
VLQAAQLRSAQPVGGAETTNVWLTSTEAKLYQAPLRPPTLQICVSHVEKLSTTVAGALLHVSPASLEVPLEPPLDEPLLPPLLLLDEAPLPLPELEEPLAPPLLTAPLLEEPPLLPPLVDPLPLELELAVEPPSKTTQRPEAQVKPWSHVPFG